MIVYLKMSIKTMIFMVLLVVSASSASADAAKIWDIWRPGNCYSQDFGSVYREPGWDRYLMYYGAVTDKGGASSCKAGGYSEDIWVTWSTTDGLVFGQTAGVTPPIIVLRSRDMQTKFGVGEGACQGCTGWLIGDAAIVHGPRTGTWYLYFDAQTCKAANQGTWAGTYVATSNAWQSGWQIQGKVDAVPGLVGPKPFAFPRAFRDPSNGLAYLYYIDGSATIRPAQINDISGGKGLSLTPAPSSTLPARSSDTISPFYDQSKKKYYAIADNFGNGKLQDLQDIWLLGPSSTPLYFDWSSRRPIVQRNGWHAGAMMGVSALSAGSTTDGTARAYFWSSGTVGVNSCTASSITAAGGLRISP